MVRPALITPVKGWRTWHRQYSTWLAASGAAIVSFTPELAEALQYVWLNLPVDIKASFTTEQIRYFGAFLTLLSIPAKLIRQRKLYEQENNNRMGRKSKPDVSRQDSLDC